MYRTKNFELVNNHTCTFRVLLRNGRSMLEEFLEKVEKVAEDKKCLYKIIALMDLYGVSRLPKTKFKHIQDNKHPNLYEFKEKRLRIYVLIESPNVIVVLGGYKGTQKNDIARLKRTVKEYNEQSQ